MLIFISKFKNEKANGKASVGKYEGGKSSAAGGESLFEADRNY